MKKSSGKILLYNAINRAFFASDIDPINLGLLSLSSVLKRHGHRVVLIPNIESPRCLKILRKELKSATLVGISCMTGDPILNGIKFSRAVRKINSRIPICWGGYHVTADYLNVMKEEFIDYIVRGQGEKTIVELVSAIRCQTSFRRIKGLVYRKNGQIVVNPPRPPESIDQFPPSDYQLYFDCYSNSPIDMTYCSSRGCPFECTFCSVSQFYGRKYLTYSTDRFLSDINHIVNTYHPTTITFWDDNFFVDLTRVNAFLDEYLQKKYTFNWWAQSRAATFANPPPLLLQRLHQCHCHCISIGAESGSPRMLKLIKKHLQPADIYSSCRNISKYGITPDYGFVSGFPGETTKDLYQTLGVIRRLLKINPHIGIRLYGFLPFPNTPILVDCAKSGFSPPVNLIGWSKYEFHSFITPWITENHRQLVKSLIWITAFVSPTTMPTAGRWYIDLPLKFLHYDAKFRLQHNFYGLAYEWNLYYSLYKRHYQT